MSAHPKIFQLSAVQVSTIDVQCMLSTLFCSVMLDGSADVEDKEQICASAFHDDGSGSL
jgi:hypothetical protein